jgi:hypothetical protein
MHKHLLKPYILPLTPTLMFHVSSNYFSDNITFYMTGKMVKKYRLSCKLIYTYKNMTGQSKPQGENQYKHTVREQTLLQQPLLNLRYS